MKTFLIAVIAFNAGFLAYPLYRLWVLGRTSVIGFYLWTITGIIIDLSCQLWLDITGIFRRKSSS